LIRPLAQIFIWRLVDDLADSVEDEIGEQDRRPAAPPSWPRRVQTDKPLSQNGVSRSLSDAV